MNEVSLDRVARASVPVLLSALLGLTAFFGSRTLEVLDRHTLAVQDHELRLSIAEQNIIYLAREIAP